MKSDMQDETLKFWTTSPNELFVAKISKNTVGMIAYQEKDASTVELNRLSVDTKFRRLGIAKRLIRHLLDQAQAQGYTRVTLTTSVNRMGVHTLYEKIGFKFSRNVTKGGFASEFNFWCEHCRIYLRFLKMTIDKSGYLGRVACCL